MQLIDKSLEKVEIVPRVFSEDFCYTFSAEKDGKPLYYKECFRSFEYSEADYMVAEKNARQVFERAGVI